MSYEKQNFAKGQMLKAEHLNHIEEGMEAIIQSVDDLAQTITKIIYSETEPEGAQGSIWLKPVEDTVVES